MAKAWTRSTAFSGVVPSFGDLPIVADAPLVVPPGKTLIRAILWWDFRAFTPFAPASGLLTPLSLDALLVAVENDTGEPPPPGPLDPMLQTLIVAPHMGAETVPSSPATDLFRSWHGWSGANGVDVSGARAGVNYSGGALIQLRLQPVPTGFHPEGWYADSRYMLTTKLALLVQG